MKKTRIRPKASKQWKRFQDTRRTNLPRSGGTSIEIAAGSGVIVVFFVALLIGGSVLFYFPISPSITGTFTIQTTSTVQISFFGLSYSKTSLVRGLAARNGNLTLTSRPAQLGSYTLTISVTYGSLDDFSHGLLTPLLTTPYLNAGDGSYAFQILFLYRAETSGVPYIISVSVAGPTTQSVLVSVLVYPS